MDCGACLNVCPQTKEVQTIDNQQAYIVLTKDANIKKISASGGVFGTVAKSLVNERNAYVCAASFVKGAVRHIITQDYSDIKKCQGSKYVQSSLEDCFILWYSMPSSSCLLFFGRTPIKSLYFRSYLPWSS